MKDSEYIARAEAAKSRNGLLPPDLFRGDPRAPGVIRRLAARGKWPYRAAYDGLTDEAIDRLLAAAEQSNEDGVVDARPIYQGLGMKIGHYQAIVRLLKSQRRWPYRASQRRKGPTPELTPEELEANVLAETRRIIGDARMCTRDDGCNRESRRTNAFARWVAGI